jgi:TolB-like protein/Flp pilus assembly protein TadD
MRLCPECRREYLDGTLIFCLDDGARLLDGPGANTEPATVLFGGNTPNSETPDRIAEPQPVLAAAPRWRSLAVLGAAIVLIGAAAFGLYRYISTPSAAGRIGSIAVMPFVNETGNPELEYLADGMTETLIASLGSLPDLSVKSRSSVFRYKGQDRDARSIGSELTVPAIVTGRVVQRGQDLTLYIELVDTATENSLWKNTYNRKLSDLVDLQSEIARDVARKLDARLSGSDEARLTRNYTADPEAYQLYMRGRFHTLRVTRPELMKAVRSYEKAIELDPNYALAYVGLADAYRGLALAGELDPQLYFPKAKAAALKAVELDDGLAETHALLGWVIFWYDWDWPAAEQQCRRALELDPKSGDAHMSLAHILSALGKHAEANDIARRGREADPLNARTSAIEAQFLIYAGRNDEAIERLRAVLDLDPDYWFANQFLASALIEKGLYDEAVSAGDKGRATYPENTRNISFVAYALAKAGRTAEARARLSEMLAMRERQFVPPFNIAIVYAGLGENKEAISWLQRGIVERDPRMVFLYCEPKLKTLKGDPEFEALLRRMRFQN